MRVACPACGMLLSCDGGPSGKPDVCPSCRKVIGAHPQEGAIAAGGPPARPSDGAFTTETPIPCPAANDLLDLLPGGARPTGPARLGHLFARDEGIDPNEVFVGKVADATEAKVLLTGWRQEMPEVPSSYRSSGALPAPGLMIAGSLLGGVAGFLAAGLVVPIGGALGALIGLFAWFYEWFRHGSAEYQWYFVVIFGILAWVLAASWVPAELTMRFGRLGKNRNVPVASVLSFLSSLLALLLAGMCYYTMAKPILAQRRWDNDLLPYFVGLLGVTGACFAAFYTAEQVRAAKFCEDCQCYMDAESLKTLGLGELRTMVRALAKARLDVAGSLLHDRPTGGDGKVNLFSCPYCSRGYLEVTAKYNARWQDWRARAMDKQRSWLAASCELTAAEVIQLRRELAGPK